MYELHVLQVVSIRSPLSATELFLLNYSLVSHENDEGFVWSYYHKIVRAVVLPLLLQVLIAIYSNQIQTLCNSELWWFEIKVPICLFKNDAITSLFPQLNHWGKCNQAASLLFWCCTSCTVNTILSNDPSSCSRDSFWLGYEVIVVM